MDFSRILVGSHIDDKDMRDGAFLQQFDSFVSDPDFIGPLIMPEFGRALSFALDQFRNKYACADSVGIWMMHDGDAVVCGKFSDESIKAFQFRRFA